jgi:hypothetical protein
MTRQSKHLYEFGSHGVVMGSVSSCGEEPARPPSREFRTSLEQRKEQEKEEVVFQCQLAEGGEQKDLSVCGWMLSAR